MGHAGAVWTLAALEGCQLASGSDDMTVKIWDLATCSCIVTWDAYKQRVFCLAVVDGGHGWRADRLASGADDKKIKLWDLQTGSCVATLKGHAQSVTALVVLKDGRLASGSSDSQIKLWELATTVCERTLDGHAGRVNCLTALEGDRLASGSEDRTIKIWDLAIGSCVATLEPFASVDSARSLYMEGRSNHPRVSSVLALQAGRLACGSGGGTIASLDPALLEVLK